MTPLGEELRVRRFFFQRSFSVRRRSERADNVEVEKGVGWGGKATCKSICRKVRKL